jgi:hypothetical protein
MKNFNKFLEEITIKGNPGVPGEGGKQPGDKDYLSDVERRAKQRMGLTGRENPMQFAKRMMELLEKSLQLTRGKESELEELATNIILSNFEDILDGVELDIKLVRSGQEVAEFMDEESDDQPEMPSFREVTDPELIRRIHKAKLGNVIIQGEAKNTKHILHTDEIKNDINQIFGEQRGGEIFRIWDELSKLADKMDWIIPIEVKVDMFERAPQGMGGAVKVDWKPKEKEEKEVNQDNFDDEPQIEEESYTPVIRARAIDFPMLIHETVKGIFELIAAVSQPGMDANEKEIEMAETVKLNVSSFGDEAEDFRTGPEIAADFRDFINENSKSNNYPNIRAYIFGMMMDPNYMTSEEFLKLFRGVLNKTSDARRKIDSMIDEVVDKLKSYDLEQALPGESYQDGDYEDEFDEVDYEDDILNRLTNNNSGDVKKEKDLSDLSQKEIQKLIDDALDNGNFEEVRKLSQFLKEGKEIYLKELERINEGYSFHTRIK